VPSIIMEPGVLPAGLSPFQTYQAYNCLDSCVTAQLLPVMKGLLNENTAGVYKREMRVASLCLEMSRKGLPTDPMEVLEFVRVMEREAAKAKDALHLFCSAVWGPFLNPNSWQQVEHFFYDFLELPPIWKYDHKTKQRKRGTDRDSLEKLRDSYPSAQPFINAILTFRESTKLASVFKKGLEPRTGRLRCSVSPSGTETGRLSSQANPFRRGTNAQNLNDRVRRVVRAPEGFLLAYPDLKTAESFVVGFRSGCRAYIDACATDLHTTVSRMVWSKLPWTEVLAENKAIAERQFYRGFSYRDMAKRGGHLTNYYGQPPMMAMHLKIDRGLCVSFQQQYFEAFPEIPEWQLDVIARLQREGKLTTIMGRERMFWGRPDDPATHREGIAYEPQSVVADVMNEGLCNVQDWLMRECDYGRIMANADAGLLMQVHDAGLFLIPLDGAAEILENILQRMVVPVHWPDMGEMVIPAEMSIGLNWGKQKDKNPAGLTPWHPGQGILLAA
jgi:DNA polymerase I-like protein with 3'-5' exonuclease and polymerase domains